MSKEHSEEAVERVAKALFDHKVKEAQNEFDAIDLGLDDASDFFLKLRAESDAALVVLATSYIDTQLTAAWTRNMPGKSNNAIAGLMDNSGPLATMSSKIRLAHALDWMSDEMNTDLHIIRKIRNKFAHDPYAQSLDDAEVVPLINSLESSEVVIFDNLKDDKVPIPVLSPRLKYHMRAAMICHRLVLQMAAAPVAVRNQVPRHVVIGPFEEGPDSRRAIARSQARTLLELMGVPVKK